MIAQASVDIAGQQGRSIGLTTVPLLNQPVVNAAGKSNMKELLRPGRTRSLLNKIAGGLGVKTFGAGYSTETTIPKRFADGGMVYREKGSTGPEFKPMGTDTVPAMLTPGEFVVKADAVTPQTLPLLQSMNNNNGAWLAEREEQVKVPRLTNLSPSEMKSLDPSFRGSSSGYQIKGTSGLYIGDVTDPAILKKYPYLVNQNTGSITVQMMNKALEASAVGRRLPIEVMQAGIAARSGQFRSSTEQALHAMADSGIITKIDASRLSNDIHARYAALPGSTMLSDGNNPFWKMSDSFIKRGLSGNPDALSVWDDFSKDISVHTNSKRRSTTARSLAYTSPSGAKVKVGKLQGSGGDLLAHSTTPKPLLNRVMSAGITSMMSRRVPLWGPGRRRFANGGMVYMAGGGMVPATQYFQDGSDGPVAPSRITFGSAYSQQREKGFVGKGMMGAPMAGMGVGMGMGMAGSAIGGQTGQMMQMASILPMMAPGLLSGIPKMLGNITGGLKGVGGAAGLAGKAIGMFANAGPLLALTAAITVAYLGFKKFKEEQEQNRIEQSNSIGITEKSASEAGIKYNNLSNSIKAVNDQLELTKAKGMNAYESLNSSGIQGLTLSIKELKANIKEAKENQTELVSTFTNIDVSGDANKQAKVLEIATNLKAQLVAAGMSAQDATNEIYSIISASDKADMAFNAISSRGFRQIIDSTTAADAMITKLSKNMGTLSAEDLGNSISNATAALDVNLKKLMTTKDENGKMMTQQEAMSQILDEINAKEGSRTTITQGQIEALKKTHPQLAEILNTSDDVAGMYSKWRLLLSGVRTDLRNISSEQAQALAAFEAALDASITSSETTSSGSGVMAKSQRSIAALQKLIASGGQKAAANAQKTQEQIKEEIKLIDKKIDKINQEADARKRALDAAQSKENLSLEIQKAQLEYADKMAAGDMAGAAQAQLKIKQLVGERETQKAINAIEENRAKREKELIAQRERLQAQSDKTAKNLSNAQNNATAAGERMNKVDQFQNEYARLIKEQTRLNVILDKDPTNKKALADQDALVRGPLGDLAKQISADARGSDKVLSAELRKIFTGTLINERGESMAGRVMPSTHPKGVATYKAGDADTALKQDAVTAMAGANKILGPKNKSLSDLYDAYMGVGTSGSTTSKTALPITEDKAKYGANTNKGGLSQIAKETIVRENKLKVGQFFEYGGNTYKVKAANYIVNQGPTVKKSLGGQFAAGQLMQVNDRINPLGAQMEGIGAFVKPNFSGTIYPNAATMPRYDVGSYSTSTRIKQGAGDQSSSNVTINATLNFGESPKSGRELWKEFKQIAKAEGAKIGENIVIGGSY
jgi:hypothetical protein